MARPILKNNSRGSALVEAVPVSAMLAAFVVAMLACAYLLFAQAWVASESERAMYCLAENRSPSECRRTLRERVERTLPWGEIRSLSLSGSTGDWIVNLEWEWNGIAIRLSKRLRMKDITGNRVLRW